MTPLDAILFAYRTGFRCGQFGWCIDNPWCDLNWDHGPARMLAYAFEHGRYKGHQLRPAHLLLTSLTHAG